MLRWNLAGGVARGDTVVGLSVGYAPATAHANASDGSDGDGADAANADADSTLLPLLEAATREIVNALVFGIGAPSSGSSDKGNAGLGSRSNNMAFYLTQRVFSEALDTLRVRRSSATAAAGFEFAVVPSETTVITRCEEAPPATGGNTDGTYSFTIHVPMPTIEALAAAKIADGGKAFLDAPAAAVNAPTTSSSGANRTGNNRDRLSRYGKLRALLVGDVLGAALSALVNGDTSSSSSCAAPLALSPHPPLPVEGLVALMQSVVLMTTSVSLARLAPATASTSSSSPSSSSSCGYDAHHMYEVIRKLASEVSSGGAFTLPKEYLRSLLMPLTQAPANALLTLGDSSTATVRSPSTSASDVAPASASSSKPLLPLASNVELLTSLKPMPRHVIVSRKDALLATTAAAANNTCAIMGSAANPSLLAKKQEEEGEGAVKVEEGGAAGSVVRVKEEPVDADVANKPRKILSLKSRIAANKALAAAGVGPMNVAADGGGEPEGASSIGVKPEAANAPSPSGVPSSSTKVPSSASSSVLAALTTTPPPPDAHVLRHYASAMLLIAVERALREAMVAEGRRVQTLKKAARAIMHGGSDGAGGGISAAAYAEGDGSNDVDVLLARLMMTTTANSKNNAAPTKGRRIEGCGGIGGVGVDGEEGQLDVAAVLASCLESLLLQSLRVMFASSLSSSTSSSDTSDIVAMRRSSSLSLSLLGGLFKALGQRFVADGPTMTPPTPIVAISSAPAVFEPPQKQQQLVVAADPPLANPSSRAPSAVVITPASTEVTLKSSRPNSTDDEEAYRNYVAYLARLRKEAIRALLRDRDEGGGKKKKKKGGKKKGSTRGHTNDGDDDKTKKLRKGGKRARDDDNDGGASSGDDGSGSDADDDDGGYDTEDDIYINRNGAWIDAKVRTLQGVREHRLVDVQCVFSVCNSSSASSATSMGKASPTSSPVGVAGGGGGPLSQQDFMQGRYKCVVYRHVAFKRRVASSSGPSSSSSGGTAATATLASGDVCYPVASFTVTPQMLQPLQRWEEGSGGGASSASANGAYVYHSLVKVTPEEWLKQGGYLPPTATAAVLGKMALGGRVGGGAAHHRRAGRGPSFLLGDNADDDADTANGFDEFDLSARYSLYEYRVGLSVDPLLTIPSSALLGVGVGGAAAMGGNANANDHHDKEDKSATTKKASSSSSSCIALDGPEEAIMTELFYALLVPIGVEVVEDIITSRTPQAPPAAMAGGGGEVVQSSHPSPSSSVVVVDPSALLEMLPVPPPLPAPAKFAARSASLSPYILTLPYAVRFVAEARRRNAGNNVMTRQMVRMFEVDRSLLSNAANPSNADDDDGDNSDDGGEDDLAGRGRRRGARQQQQKATPPPHFLIPVVGTLLPIATLSRVCAALRRCLTRTGTAWGLSTANSDLLSNVSDNAPPGCSLSSDADGFRLVIDVGSSSGSGKDDGAISSGAVTATYPHMRACDDARLRLLHLMAFTFQCVTNGNTRSMSMQRGGGGGSSGGGVAVPCLPPPMIGRVRSLYDALHSNTSSSSTLPPSLLALNGPIYTMLFGDIAGYAAPTGTSTVNSWGVSAGGDDGPSSFDLIRRAAAAFVDALCFAVMSDECPPAIAARLHWNAKKKAAATDEGTAAADASDSAAASPPRPAQRAVLKLGSRFKNLSTASAADNDAKGDGGGSALPIVPPPPVMRRVDPEALCALLDGAYKRLTAAPPQEPSPTEANALHVLTADGAALGGASPVVGLGAALVQQLNSAIVRVGELGAQRLMADLPLAAVAVADGGGATAASNNDGPSPPTAPLVTVVVSSWAKRQQYRM